jgi:cytochrome c oxidase subunit III
VAKAALPSRDFAEHFDSALTQHHALRMGMWLFLATEVLLFTGLFVGYSVYRYLYPGTFAEASKLLDDLAGTANTAVLITSSLTVALAVHAASQGKNRVTLFFLALSLALGAAFLGVKGFEYAHKFHQGALPGHHYRYPHLTAPGASLFFTLYFLLTGLHAFHVVVGLLVLGFMAIRAWRGAFTRERNIGMELAGLYWHLVDLIWIFLYPLLYLI